MKKIIALILTIVLMLPVCAMGASAEGTVLNIYCWNEEFKTRFEAFYTMPEGIEINWILTPNTDGAYQNALDEALLNQENVDADSRIDMFLVEADYAVKYSDSDFTLDVIADVGLTAEDIADMYPYTKAIMTVGDTIKGVSWQACPGGFIYRRTYAKEVLGTDDPAAVQQFVADWEKFGQTAAEMKKAGYFMLSGFDDAYRCFSDNMSAPWVVDGMIQKDPVIEQWVTMTKEYTDLGYNNKANLWSAESSAGAGLDGKVFGYFGPAWFIDFSLAKWTLSDSTAEPAVGNGSWGDWAFCQGPQGFSWGGTWLCAAAGTDNLSLVKDIMYKMTCDQETLVKIVEEYGDFTNSVTAMTQMASGDYQNAFLGGQNHLALFLENAQNIVRAKSTAYDQTCTEKLMAAMVDYFNGVVDLDTAWDNFFISVEEVHPELFH